MTTTAVHVPASSRTVRYVVKDHPRNVQGVYDGLEYVRERIDRGRKSRLVNEWARQVVAQTPGALEPRGRPQPRKIALAIFEALKKRVGFVRDPVDAELMIEAEALLCLDPDGACIPAGDCDDQIIALGSALMALGIPIRLRLRFYKGQGQAHVTIEYDQSPRLADDWTCIDPSVPDGVCSSAPYEKEITMLVHQGDPKHGDFIGMGSPPHAPHASHAHAPHVHAPHDFALRRWSGDRWFGHAGDRWAVITEPSCETWSDPIIDTAHGIAIRDMGFLQREATMELEQNGGNPVIERWTDGRLYLFTRENGGVVVRACTGPLGAMGDPPDVGTMGADAPAAELAPDEAAIWIEQARIAQQTLLQDAANLTRWREAFIKARADLGLPQYDAAPSGEQTPSDSPLHQYAVTNRRWTQQADKDEQKLLSTAAWMAAVIGDALAGTRPIYWQDGDLAFGAKDGDPYWIRMVKQDDGSIVPMYVDPKTQQPTGQIGAVHVVVVAGVVVVVALALAAAWNMDKIFQYLAQRHHDDMLAEMAQRESELVASGKATPEQVAQMKRAQADFASASVLPQTKSFPWAAMLLIALAGALGGAALAAYGAPALRHAHGRIKGGIERRFATAGESRRRRRYAPPHDPAFVRRKIRTLRREGYPQDQAVAIAHRMDRERAAEGPPARAYAPNVDVRRAPSKDDAMGGRAYSVHVMATRAGWIAESSPGRWRTQTDLASDERDEGIASLVTGTRDDAVSQLLDDAEEAGILRTRARPGGRAHAYAF